jgi:hypothetical protein
MKALVWGIGKFLVIALLFYITSQIIGFMSKPPTDIFEIVGIKDSYGIFFTFSVFLGSASYNFCSKLLSMRDEHFWEFSRGLMIATLTLATFIITFIIVSLLLSFDGEWEFAFGVVSAIILIVIEVYIIIDIDKFIDKTIRNIRAS